MCSPIICRMHFRRYEQVLLIGHGWGSGWWELGPMRTLTGDFGFELGTSPCHIMRLEAIDAS